MSKLCKIALLLLLCATTAAGFLWLPPAVGFQNPALARIFVFHTPCAMAAYLASGVALWYAVRYLRGRDLHDDLKSRVSFGLAVLFWALTTVTGAIFAKAQWGAYWNWDPRETAMFLLLLVCLAYFALRAAVDEPRKRATLSAAYALFAVVAVPFLSYVLPNATDQTLHPKGVITTRGGLSPEYEIVFWAGTLGLCLVYLWAFRLHVAIGSIEMRLHRRPSLITGKEPNPFASQGPSLLGKGGVEKVLFFPSLTGKGQARSERDETGLGSLEVGGH